MSQISKGQRIELDSTARSTLQSSSIFEDDRNRLLLHGRYYSPDKALHGGYKSVVWRVFDDYGSPLAAKFATADDYELSSFHSEISRRRALPYGLFTRCYDADYWKTSKIPNTRFVVTIEDWIDGQTLKAFLSNPDNVTPAALLHYGEAISGALEALEAAGLEHDDLHTSNVILRESRPGELAMYPDSIATALQVTVVDTGSLKARTDSSKSRNDVKNVASHLIDIYNVLRLKQDLTVNDRRFLREVLQIVRLMTDDDASRALRSGSEIREQLRAAYSRANAPSNAVVALGSPFEYISAEQISDDRLLLDLFTATPWLDDVTSRDRCLVTGPRGCGKSTIFRWLALRTHLNGTSPVDLDRLTIIGFYISCTADLQNRLGWIRSQELAEKYEPEIVHYFNLLVTREILQTFLAIERQPDAAERFGLDAYQKEQILRFLCKYLAQPHRALAGTSLLRQALEMVEREMFASHRRMLRDELTATPLAATFLGDFTSTLVELMPIFDQYRIAFLLDDFSMHRVPASVQQLLGPIIWERRASHIFKVSSEKYGTEMNYQGGGTADVSREYFEIDCGKAYIDLSDRANTARNRSFATQLLKNRLKVAGWAGTPEGLIGDSPEYSELITGLRDKSNRSGAHYYGLSVIADLCSGDLATLLLVYRKVLARANSTTTTRVSPNFQHAAITEVSRELLSGISLHRPFGKEMHNLAAAFGEFTGRCLRDGRRISEGQKGLVPIEVPRIEVDQGQSAQEELPEELGLLARELIRRGVFIEMDIGRSRHRYVTTLRWHFRRIYMPSFRAGLHKNDAVKISPSVFRWLLQEPRQALEAQFRQRAEAYSRPDGQGELDFNSKQEGGL